MKPEQSKVMIPHTHEINTGIVTGDSKGCIPVPTLFNLILLTPYIAFFFLTLAIFVAKWLLLGPAEIS